MFEPSFDSNALRVLERRYLRRDPAGRLLETPDELLWRVARAVAQADSLMSSGVDVDALAESFHDEMASLRFLPNSPALGAGRSGAQLAACFVLPIHDDLASIFETLKQAALVHQSGGGTGFGFSELRPAGDEVASSGGIASGPVSFLRLYDAATEVIKQGGVRRGANMGVLRIDHPDILAFVGEKADPSRLRNFNLSVAVTDGFMAVVEADGYYDLFSPRDGAAKKRLLARKVWRAIIHHAWYSGEPGVLFLDRIEAANPTPLLGSLYATNPCGEQPLLPYESCTLGSINLPRFLEENASLDWQRLRQTVWLAVRFLDDLVEASSPPIEQIREATMRTRKIGLGVMGYADALIEMEVAYDSPEALDFAREVMKFVRDEAREASGSLAKSRGAFPGWPGSRLEERGLSPQRNATVTTIAPTGTLSLLAGCSSGIEPIYDVRFTRNVLGGEGLEQISSAVVKHLAKRGLNVEETLERVREAGSLRRLPDLPEMTRRVVATAADIAPDWHVRAQAAFQEFTDNAVSKTVNLPRESTPADVERVLWLAYELGCKGITVYREGSRPEQVLERHGRSPKTVSSSRGGAVRSCPDCREPLPRDGRCLLCRACGWSTCLVTNHE